jgi:hypothetical protein
MEYTGVIIEESLADTSVLRDVDVTSTEVEAVTSEHKTPWVKQWTLHAVSIEEYKASIVARNLSRSLDPEHVWYADFKNDTHHYIVFRDKVFFVDRGSKEQYDKVIEYALSRGIPKYQVDFQPEVNKWDR